MFHRLGHAVAGEADIELTCVTFTYRGNGPIYETSAQSMELSGSSYLSYLQVKSIEGGIKASFILGATFSLIRQGSSILYGCQIPLTNGG